MNFISIQQAYSINEEKYHLTKLGPVILFLKMGEGTATANCALHPLYEKTFLTPSIP